MLAVAVRSALAMPRRVGGSLIVRPRGSKGRQSPWGKRAFSPTGAEAGEDVTVCADTHPCAEYWSSFQSRQYRGS